MTRPIHLWSLAVALLLAGGLVHAEAVGNMTTGRMEAAPAIDGNLAEGEWDAAEAVDFEVAIFPFAELMTILQGGGVPPDTLAGKLYMGSDDENLYVGISILANDFNGQFDPDAGQINSDMLMLSFDSDGREGSSIGDDRKIVIPAAGGFYVDQHRISVDQGADDHADDPIGNGNGAISHSTEGAAGDYFVEMTIPLTSGDDKDLAVAPGGKVGFQLIFIDGMSTADMGATRVALLAGPGWTDLAMGVKQFVELTVAQ